LPSLGHLEGTAIVRISFQSKFGKAFKSLT
jgi:hypothetical protein